MSSGLDSQDARHGHLACHGRVVRTGPGEGELELVQNLGYLNDFNVLIGIIYIYMYVYEDSLINLMKRESHFWLCVFKVSVPPAASAYHVLHPAGSDSQKIQNINPLDVCVA